MNKIHPYLYFPDLQGIEHTYLVIRFDKDYNFIEFTACDHKKDTEISVRLSPSDCLEFLNTVPKWYDIYVVRGGGEASSQPQAPRP